MPLFAVLYSEIFILAAAALAVLASAAVCGVVVSRWRQRRPAIPYQPRRPAPWGALEMTCVALLYLAAQAGVLILAATILGPHATRTPPIYNPDKENSLHVTLQLMAEANGWVLLLCGVSAIIVAPVAEEFLFRVVLQGWLESLEHRWRRRMPTLRRLLPRACLPIALTSFLFAMMHFRLAGPPIDKSYLLLIMAGSSAATLLTAVLALVLLRRRTGATAADFGWSPGKIRGDAWLGLSAFAAVAAPIYAAQYDLHLLLPTYLAPDPFALFLFALALGTLFYRTHRIVPAIVLHVSLNGTSFLLAWLGSG